MSRVVRFSSLSLSLLFLAAFMLSLTASSEAQDVTTWHYNDNRTGWQQNETTLTTTGSDPVSQTNFGKTFQYNVGGAVYAQPLALSSVNGMGDVVFVATEEDMLYAFPAGYTNTTTPTPMRLMYLDFADRSASRRALRTRRGK